MIVNDGQGNIRAIVENGTVTDTYRYDAYGNLLEKTRDSDNDLLYNGEQFSVATGLYYLRARNMDLPPADSSVWTHNPENWGIRPACISTSMPMQTR